MAKGKSGQCQLRVPKNYDPIRPRPLLVWFSGDPRSHVAKGASGLVDFDEFLVLALPYPNGRLPRLAVEAGAGEINAFWEFQKDACFQHSQSSLRLQLLLLPNLY